MNTTEPTGSPKPPYIVVDDIPRGRGRTFPRERVTFLRGVKAAAGKWCRYTPGDADTSKLEARLDHLRKLADEDTTGTYRIVGRRGDVYAMFIKDDTH